MREDIVRLEQIDIDGNTQPRLSIDKETIKEYKEAMAEMPRDHIQFPPLCLMQEGKHLWLIDGFHRYYAAKELQLTHFRAKIEEGTLDQAQWKCLAANIKNGLRRTNKDKKNAVLRALQHPLGKGATDRAIAVHCGVSQTMVSEIRANLPIEEKREDRNIPKKGLNGKTYISRERQVTESVSSRQSTTTSGAALASVPESPSRKQITIYADECYHAPSCNCQTICDHLRACTCFSRPLVSDTL